MTKGMRDGERKSGALNGGSPMSHVGFQKW